MRTELSLLGFDEGDHVGDLLELFGIGIEDFDFELVLESHHELNAVEGVSTEVVAEFGFRLHIFSLDFQLGDDNVGNLLENFFLCHCLLHLELFEFKFNKKRLGVQPPINALHGQAGQANYAAAKAGIIGMTKSNAMEFSSRGITVNAIAPGFIGTDMTAAMDDATKEKYAAQIPLGRIGKPEDVANAVAFLASDDACYITGQILGVDGGLNA